jgi:hypothetical protein
MPHVLPAPEQLFGAIELYLRCAYDGALPAAVKATLETLHAGGDDPYRAQAFTRAGPAEPPRLLLRLGNRHYPHMKLALEPAPSADTYLFRADTHDRHICPAPDHPEYASFMQLRSKNQAIGSAIEQAWAEAGIPTFKTFLEQDLARRQAQPRDIKP